MPSMATISGYRDPSFERMIDAKNNSRGMPDARASSRQ